MDLKSKYVGNGSIRGANTSPHFLSMHERSDRDTISSCWLVLSNRGRDPVRNLAAPPDEAVPGTNGQSKPLFTTL